LQSRADKMNTDLVHREGMVSEQFVDFNQLHTVIQRGLASYLIT